MVAEENYFSGSEHGEYALVLDGNKEIFGAGSLAEVGAHGRVLGMTRVALFTDARLAKLPAVETAVKSLRDKGIKVTVFDGVEIEPSDRSLKAALRFAESDTFDGFVSVGGGSVMDTCKAVSLYASYPPADFLDYVNKPLGKALPAPGPLKPHIACPTTFGTSSECTNVAIFNFLELGTKAGISNRAIKPTLGIIDPNALKTLPSQVVASNGMDVFSHAVESYTARPFTSRPVAEDPTARPVIQGSNPFSDMNCLEAIRLIGQNLVRAVQDPDDIAAREKLSFSGLLGGIGFRTAGCNLPHGMSYAVAGLVRDYHAKGWPDDHPLVPHGFAVIVNSPSVFRYMGSTCPERYTEAARALGMSRLAADQDAGDYLAGGVIELMKEVGAPNGLTALGYTAADLDALTEKGWPQRRVIDNAAKAITKDELRRMFEGALSYW
ncbi:hydroxyacid-oxoacid transhydrogenase [Pelobacter seleniigenes]|uniref:hydroxyacid-oxoacid transhydrogenase n=1 Tax=Pelobacter seleniigenes TaxID=407188 RepID=UPI0004A6B4EE|nr:hydroxyacid-oxoacid transhydrogenase [Pelobacter seleniigenes]